MLEQHHGTRQLPGLAFLWTKLRDQGARGLVEKEGGAVSGFYHSHVDCEAYFSAEDKERAMAWDEPAYPEAIYLVVSVYGDDPRGSKAFAWDAAQTDFVEVEIAVQD